VEILPLTKFKRSDIPALTGLRFFAAFFVVFSHALHSIPDGPQFPAVLYYISDTSALGMTLFFVLSGFVIHYNYRETIHFGGVVGFWNFFVARFSRLYPLYFLLMAWEIYQQGYVNSALLGNEGATEKLLSAAPYYLTLTQSWFFFIVGDNSLIYQFHLVGSIAWSISTEWFFYLCYPIICAALYLLRGKSMKLIVILCLSVVAFGGVWLVVKYAARISDFAMGRYGLPAGMIPSTQDSLFRWLIYFSPYSRVSEFILGVLICGIYLDLTNSPAGIVEKFLARSGSAVAIVALAAIHICMFMPSAPFPILTQYHMCFGYAIPVALLIFCVARYDNPIQRVLAWRPIVMAGEASYSLYFLHILVVGYFLNHRSLIDVDRQSFIQVSAVAMGIAIIALLLSLVSYRVIEVPTRNWFRKALTSRSSRTVEETIAGPRWFITRGAVLFCLVIAPLGILVLRVPPKLVPPPEGTLEIVEATYGRSCKASEGNVTKSVVSSCSGDRHCNYVVDVYRLGDPAGGCSKDFDVRWRCGRKDEIKFGHVDAEAGLGGKSVLMQCDSTPSAN
jgi:peptidoglycan/LPS O-acetylase OafA/YrhL